MVLADIGLVDPGAGEVEAGGDACIGSGLLAMGFVLGAEGGLEGAGAAGLQPLVGGALQLDVLDAALLAELTLLGTAALGIDDEDVGLDEVERGEEVDDAPTLVDIGFLDGLDIAYHKQTLLLREHGLAVLVLEVGGIGADAYIEVAKLGGLLKELDMAAMKEVVTTGNEDFFGHIAFEFSVKKTNV